MAKVVIKHDKLMSFVRFFVNMMPFMTIGSF